LIFGEYYKQQSDHLNTHLGRTVITDTLHKGLPQFFALTSITCVLRESAVALTFRTHT